MEKQYKNTTGVPAVVGQFELDHNEGFISKALNIFLTNGQANASLIDQKVGLRACLDNLQLNVFVADQNFNLIYMNIRAVETMNSIESEIQKAFGLRVEELLGGSIHRFHKDPRAVESVLRNPAS